MRDSDSAELRAHAARCGLADDEVVITGYVADADLIALYQAATLFIFPSLHEGFGLLALEAMACGAAVIGSDSTSIPEVIGLAEAMFDARSPQAMASRIGEVLGDPALLARLPRAAAARPPVSRGIRPPSAPCGPWKTTWRLRTAPGPRSRGRTGPPAGRAGRTAGTG
ncbi:glycosyltransferase [Massilia sp. B-10]|nr:glycosyltransferase [Massilia sp. B-10]